MSYRSDIKDDMTRRRLERQRLLATTALRPARVPGSEIPLEFDREDVGISTTGRVDDDAVIAERPRGTAAYIRRGLLSVQERENAERRRRVPEPEAKARGVSGFIAWARASLPVNVFGDGGRGDGKGLVVYDSDTEELSEVEVEEEAVQPEGDIKVEILEVNDDHLLDEGLRIERDFKREYPDHPLVSEYRETEEMELSHAVRMASRPQASNRFDPTTGAMMPGLSEIDGKNLGNMRYYVFPEPHPMIPVYAVPFEKPDALRIRPSYELYMRNCLKQVIGAEVKHGASLPQRGFQVILLIRDVATNQVAELPSRFVGIREASKLVRTQNIPFYNIRRRLKAIFQSQNEFKAVAGCTIRVVDLWYNPRASGAAYSFGDSDLVKSYLPKAHIWTERTDLPYGYCMPRCIMLDYIVKMLNTPTKTCASFDLIVDKLYRGFKKITTPVERMVEIASCLCKYPSVGEFINDWNKYASSGLWNNQNFSGLFVNPKFKTCLEKASKIMGDRYRYNRAQLGARVLDYFIELAGEIPVHEVTDGYTMAQGQRMADLFGMKLCAIYFGSPSISGVRSSFDDHWVALPRMLSLGDDLNPIRIPVGYDMTGWTHVVFDQSVEVRSAMTNEYVKASFNHWGLIKDMVNLKRCNKRTFANWCKICRINCDSNHSVMVHKSSCVRCGSSPSNPCTFSGGLPKTLHTPDDRSTAPVHFCCDCNYGFSSKLCFERHRIEKAPIRSTDLTTTYCERYRFCNNEWCKIGYDSKTKHVCESYKCYSCKEIVLHGHHTCCMQDIRIPMTHAGLIERTLFADFETHPKYNRSCTYDSCPNEGSFIVLPPMMSDLVTLIQGMKRKTETCDAKSRREVFLQKKKLERKQANELYLESKKRYVCAKHEPLYEKCEAVLPEPCTRTDCKNRADYAPMEFVVNPHISTLLCDTHIPKKKLKYHKFDDADLNMCVLAGLTCDRGACTNSPTGTTHEGVEIPNLKKQICAECCFELRAADSSIKYVRNNYANEHIVYMAIAVDSNGVERIRTDNVSDFMVQLDKITSTPDDSYDKRIRKHMVLFHNLPFDGVFMFKWMLNSPLSTELYKSYGKSVPNARRNIYLPKPTRNGTGLRAIQWGNIDFKCSLAVLPVALAKAPKTMGFDVWSKAPEEAKRVWDHKEPSAGLLKYYFPYDWPTTLYHKKPPPEAFGEHFYLNNDFKDWYQKKTLWHADYMEECYEYCLQDCRVLAASVNCARKTAYIIQSALTPNREKCKLKREKDMSASKSISIVDPFACGTLASYGNKILRCYFPVKWMGLIDERAERFPERTFDWIEVCRSAFYGGRTEDFARYWESKGDHQDAMMTDVCSEYPYVNKYCRYPSGAWSEVALPTDGDINSWILTYLYADHVCRCGYPAEYYHKTEFMWRCFRHSHGADKSIARYGEHPSGFETGIDRMMLLCVDVTCPQDETVIPILPTRTIDSKGIERVSYDLQNKKKLCYTCIDLRKALEVGYTITAIHSGLISDSSIIGPFAPYVDTFYKIKVGCSYDRRVARDCSVAESKADVERYCDEVFARDGIRLLPGDIMENEAMKSFAKFLLNSCWGRIGMDKSTRKTTEIFAPSSILGENMKIAAEHNKRFSELVALSVSGGIDDLEINTYGDGMAVVTYQHDPGASNSRPDGSIAIPVAAFTTSHGRLRLYSYMRLLNPRQILYCDTDSIMYYVDRLNPSMKNTIPTLGGLGNMTNQIAEKGRDDIRTCDERADDTIASVYIACKKCYAYVTKKGLEKMASKGISKNVIGAHRFTFDDFKKLVLGDLTRITVPQFSFKRMPSSQEIKRVENKKELKVSEPTRVFEEDGLSRPLMNCDVSPSCPRYTKTMVHQRKRQRIVDTDSREYRLAQLKITLRRYRLAEPHEDFLDFNEGFRYARLARNPKGDVIQSDGSVRVFNRTVREWNQLLRVVWRLVADTQLDDTITHIALSTPTTPYTTLVMAKLLDLSLCRLFTPALLSEEEQSIVT